MPYSEKFWQCFRNSLLSDAKPAEDQIQDVIVGGGPRNPIERTQCAVQIEQDHLVRTLLRTAFAAASSPASESRTRP